MFMHYVYILRLRDLRYYVGYSSDLKNRIKEHRRGGVRATRLFRPLDLVFYASFLNKKKALSFETYLKSSSGTAFRNKRLI